jgi:hypothetical protein
MSQDSPRGGGLGAPSRTGHGAVRVVIGTDFTLPTGFATARPSSSATEPAPATPVQGAGAGVTAPPPTALSALSGGGIASVK